LITGDATGICKIRRIRRSWSDYLRLDDRPGRCCSARQIDLTRYQNLAGNGIPTRPANDNSEAQRLQIPSTRICNKHRTFILVSTPNVRLGLHIRGGTLCHCSSRSNCSSRAHRIPSLSIAVTRIKRAHPDVQQVHRELLDSSPSSPDNIRHPRL